MRFLQLKSVTRTPLLISRNWNFWKTTQLIALCLLHQDEIRHDLEVSACLPPYRDLYWVP